MSFKQESSKRIRSVDDTPSVSQSTDIGGKAEELPDQTRPEVPQLKVGDGTTTVRMSIDPSVKAKQQELVEAILNEDRASMLKLLASRFDDLNFSVHGTAITLSQLRVLARTITV